MSAHANVAGEGGGRGPGGDDCDGLLGRNLAPGKHGLLLLFLLPLGCAAAASSAALAVTDGSFDTRGGGGLWRRRTVVDSVSVVDAEEQEKPVLQDDADDEDVVDDAYPECRGRATPVSRRGRRSAPAAGLGLTPVSDVAHQNCGGAVAFSSDRRRGAASTSSPSSRER